MLHRIYIISILFLTVIAVTGCVTAIDTTLPYETLPEITVATDVNLTASPSHPDAAIPSATIPNEEQAQVIGRDENSAYLLVVYNNLVGWMHTTLSRTNVGTLNTAIVVDPLPENCTVHLGTAISTDEVWVSDTTGEVIVQGAIYHSPSDASFDAATLSLAIDGAGKSINADYIHAPLTNDSAVVLFGFVLSDIEVGSQIRFEFANPTPDQTSFQAAFFANTCTDDLTAKNGFEHPLPIGVIKTSGEGIESTTPSNAGTASAIERVPITGAATGELSVEILSLRSGPGFAYPAVGEQLRGATVTIAHELCEASQIDNWFFVETEDGQQGWVPAAPILVANGESRQFPCQDVPPLPDPAEPTSFSTVANKDSEIITDLAQFTEYISAVGRYRLAEKAALAQPRANLIHQVPDFAAGRALSAVRDAVQQLRTRRYTADLSLRALEAQLVLVHNNGTASILVNETRTQFTYQLSATGNQLTKAEEYDGPTLYGLVNDGGRWAVSSVTPLRGTTKSTAINDVQHNRPTGTDEDVTAMKQILSVYNPPTTAPPSIDLSTFVEPTAGAIEGNLAQNTLFTQVGSPYIIRGDVIVQTGVTLFIEPGAIVKFADDSLLSVDGALIAQGTVDQPILFTSIRDDFAGGDSNEDGGATSPAPGDWTAIRFRDGSNDVNSIIEHAIIRYAGENRGNLWGAVHLESASPTILNNVFERNGWYALSGDVHSFPTVIGNQLVENVGNGFQIRQGEMRMSGTWHNTDIAYTIFGTIKVNEGATLTLAPGAVVKFANDAYFHIYGSLSAVGTLDESITMTSLKDDTVLGDTNGDGTSSAPSAGDWATIRFHHTSNDVNSMIEHTTIRYAGEHQGTSWSTIHLDSASPTIQNNVIEDSFWYAISGDVHSFPTVQGNTLRNNAGNGFQIRQGDMTTSGTWANTDMPYAILGRVTIKEGAMLSIASGATVKFGDDSYIDVFGTLQAVGTADDKIILTSLKDDEVDGDTNGDAGATIPVPGDWTMIRFRDSSNDANSIVAHSVIRYAGEHQGNRVGAIHLEAASPTIQHNTIEDGWWYALSGDVHSFPTVSGNELARNVGNGFQIRQGEMKTSGIWQNTDIPYVILGNVTVNLGTMLTINPGVVIKFGDNAYMHVGGAFRAIGTPDQAITFTSLKDDTLLGDTNGDQQASIPSMGDWAHIKFLDSSNDNNSTIEHAVVRYAGERGGKRLGTIHLESASPTLVNNTIADSFGYAISSDVHSFPDVSGNHLVRNIGNGMAIRAGTMKQSGLWRNTDIPYVVFGELRINQGAMLTVEPGVNVKFEDDSYVYIYGAFRAVGTPDQQITFTSLKDDTILGDTNGDQTASIPGAGDWTYIRFFDSSNDANSVIEHATIRYAGEHGGRRYGAIYMEGASPTISNNTITDNFAQGIWYDINSAPQMEGNRFQNNLEGDVVQAQ
ncbi:MAG: right-handed parallel beta-helix repeat-containing protein [Chloroflexota bacterium]